MHDRLKKMSIVSDSRGFTLFELLIVILILMVVVGISAPDFKTWLLHADINSDSRKMLSAFQRARMEAVNRSEFCAVAFPPLGGGKISGFFVFLDKNVNRAFDAGEKVIFSDDFDSISTEAESNFTNVAIFNSRGLPSSSATSINPVIGTVTLEAADGYSRAVRVSRFGRIRIE